MRNNTSIIFNLGLIVIDAIAIVLGLSIAYILRVSVSHEVLSAHVSSTKYLQFLIILLPFWLLIFAILGLYSESHYQNRFSEFGKVTIGCFIGVMFAISYSYMINEPLFPARLVVVYGFVFTLITIELFRTLARDIQRQLFSYGIGVNKVLIVGHTKSSRLLVDALFNTNVTGYKVVAVVGEQKINKNIKIYNSFNDATRSLKPGNIHTIIQTELYSSSDQNDEILSYAQTNHIAYRFVPGNSELFVGNIRVNLLQSTPIIAVHQTALIGWGRVVKRLTDVILGCIFLVIALPFMFLIMLAEKVSSPRGEIIYKVGRLSIFGNEVQIYKFRTMKTAYNNMTPEDGFNKMGRPELIKPYRDNGDQLPRDPRVSSLGRLLRKTSLDELPQLFNVVKGDISLVGPRALEALELDRYPKKNLILSVKSGLTGLAQISGRRDISFEERRTLDLYYVQNWTFSGDLVILLKTFWVTLFHRGAV